MEIRKGLAVIISTVGLVGLVSCMNPNNKYHFRGKIGNDKVEFLSGNLWKCNMLTVTKPDGKIIRYVDNKDNDLKLEYMTVTNDAGWETYKIETHPEILEKAQKEFDDYIKKISEHNGIVEKPNTEETSKKD